MQSEGSVGTKELGRLQCSWLKNNDQNPQLNIFLSPHSAVWLYYFLCSAPLQPTLFPSLLSCFTWSRSIFDFEGSSERPQWSTLFHSTCYLQLKGKSYLRWKPTLHFATTRSHILQSGKQILQMGHSFISYHALVRQPWIEVEAHK